MIFKGVITALITPFENDQIDYSSFYKLLDKQIEAGIDGVVVGGSTGEGSSLSQDEYGELIKAAIKHINKKIPVIAAVSAASTSEAVRKTKYLCELGVDGLMCTAPHYIRPEQNGLILHYKALSEASKVPIMLYIHPVRTACDFTDETLLEIVKFKHISSVKDATSDIEKPLRILPKTKDFTMLTGNDPSALSYNANGGEGCVSVIANIFPKLCKKIDTLWRNNDISSALALQVRLYPLFSAIFIESNPIGIKYAAYKLGLCKDEIRLPLTIANQNASREIDSVLEDLINMEKDV